MTVWPTVTPTHGAVPITDGTWQLAVWAPAADQVAAVLDGPTRSDRLIGTRDEHGWVRWSLNGVEHGDLYWIELDGRHRPDPASRWQPDGVDGPSAFVDPGSFQWTDEDWTGPDSLAGQVLYELHVGTFTDAGTFDAAIAQLPALTELGITAVELMPVNQFPGTRNWGYDGVLVSAVQNSYGGPEGLARFVDAAHDAGLAVILDVVYNHFGPEGNHLAEFGPYFTSAYSTPWGAAVNFAGVGSDQVRDLFVSSAVGFVRDLHIDGLRLDAVHAIIDPTASTFLEEITEAVHSAASNRGNHCLVIAESSDNDPRLVRDPAVGGYGMDGVWHDEVHHGIRVALTAERQGYYADFIGAADLAQALETNLVYDGRYSEGRGRRHGRPSADVDSFRYVVCDQNHDQVGNRAFGERLDTLVPADRRRLAAAVVALGPFTPMLFMGEEYGEPAPFPYFVSHSDPDLIEAVRRGRAEEFAAFEWEIEPPDPAAAETFRSAVLDRTQAEREPYKSVLQLWQRLLDTRRELPVLHDPNAKHDTELLGQTVIHHRRSSEVEVVVVWHFADDPSTIELPRGAVWTLRCSTDPDRDGLVDGHRLDVGPWEAVVLQR